MKNITILSYLIFILSIFIPLYIYKSSNSSCMLHTQFQLSKIEFEVTWLIMYILTGLSIILVLNRTNKPTKLYWLTLLFILINCLLNSWLNYSLLYTQTLKSSKYILLIITLLLSLQVFGSCCIYPMAGMLLAPVLVWYMYILNLFK